jgi:hypothetical protein
VVEFELPAPKAKFGAAPVPASTTVWGLPTALSEIISVACLIPVAVGEKVTATEQLASAARETGQLFVSEKSPEA